MNGDSYTEDAAWGQVADPLNTASTARHLEGNNYAYADGHVKWLRFGKVLPGTGDNTGVCASGGTSAAASDRSTFCY